MLIAADCWLHVNLVMFMFLCMPDSPAPRPCPCHSRTSIRTCSWSRRVSKVQRNITMTRLTCSQQQPSRSIKSLTGMNWDVSTLICSHIALIWLILSWTAQLCHRSLNHTFKHVIDAQASVAMFQPPEISTSFSHHMTHTLQPRQVFICNQPLDVHSASTSTRCAEDPKLSCFARLQLDKLSCFTSC